MQNLKLQLSTSPDVNRDMKVTLVHEATGQEFKTTPFLDGTVNMTNIPAGAYRLLVNHSNIAAAVYDNRIRVFGDRPTFVPIKIPPDIFTDRPIRETTEMDLQPPRTILASAADAAEAQARKKGGQPIFADDWNALAHIVADVARAASDLSQRVAPLGHPHQELVEKLQEIQANLARFLDVFGKSLAELQRQIQQLALYQRVNTALDRIPNLTPGQREDITKEIDTLDDVRKDAPYAYSSAIRRVAERLGQKLDATIPVDRPEIRNDTAVKDAVGVVAAMGSTTPVYTYEGELANHDKVDRQTAKASMKLAVQR